MGREHSIFTGRARSARDRFPAETGRPVSLAMDESGNGNRDQPLIVGALAADTRAEAIEAEMRELHAELIRRPSLQEHPGFERFRDGGFHAAEDLPEVSGLLLDLIRRSAGFTLYMVMTDRSGTPDLTERQRIERLYERLVGDLLIRYRRHTDVECRIEHNDELRGLADRLPGRAGAAAARRLQQPMRLPELSVRTVPKGEVMSMAIVDYAMAAVSGWVRDGRRRDAQNRHYRAFRLIEPSISMLWSVETGIVSSRRTRSA